MATWNWTSPTFEPDARGERLELLTVVRGLEALDQPSRVSVLTASRYVRNGIELGLPQWRARGWRWESFGRLERVKHADLWQRLDQAAAIHEVHCAAPARQIDCQMWPEAWHETPARASASSASRCHEQRRLDGGHGLMPRRRRRARSGFWGMVQAPCAVERGTERTRARARSRTRWPSDAASTRTSTRTSTSDHGRKRSIGLAT